MAEDVGPCKLDLRATAMGRRGAPPAAGQALSGWMAADTFVFRARSEGGRQIGSGPMRCSPCHGSGMTRSRLTVVC